MLRFRCTLLLCGVGFLTLPSRLLAVSTPNNLTLMAHSPQESMTLHAGLGVMALLLAVIGWVRRSRRNKLF